MTLSTNSHKRVSLFLVSLHFSTITFKCHFPTQFWNLIVKRLWQIKLIDEKFNMTIRVKTLYLIYAEVFELCGSVWILHQRMNLIVCSQVLSKSQKIKCRYEICRYIFGDFYCEEVFNFKLF